MKKLKIIVSLIIGLASFSSCLKDEAVISPEGTHNVVEFGNVSNITSGVDNPIRLYIAAFPVVPSDTLVIPINYAGANYASKDIKVTLELDNKLLDTLNPRQFKDGDGNPDPDQYLQPLDPDFYKLTTTATIKKGTLGTEVLIPVKIDQIDFDHAYAIALRIKDASGEIISGNFNRIVVNVTPKNPYDGVYTYTLRGYFDNKTVTGAEVETTGPNSFKGNLFFYYSNLIYYSVDPETNIITVTGIDGGYPIVNYPISKFDPATHNMHVEYDALGVHNVEDFVYTGER